MPAADVSHAQAVVWTIGLRAALLDDDGEPDEELSDDAAAARISAHTAMIESDAAVTLKFTRFDAASLEQAVVPLILKVNPVRSSTLHRGGVALACCMRIVDAPRAGVRSRPPQDVDTEAPAASKTKVSQVAMVSRGKPATSSQPQGGGSLVRCGARMLGSAPADVRCTLPHPASWRTTPWLAWRARRPRALPPWRCRRRPPCALCRRPWATCARSSVRPSRRCHHACAARLCCTPA